MLPAEKLFLPSLFSRNFYQIFTLFKYDIHLVSEFHGSIFINFHDPLSMNNVIDVSIIYLTLLNL